MTNDNQEIVTPEDHELFRDIAKEIRSNPGKYSEAGKWLDEYCSETGYWQRQENKLKELQAQEKRFPTLPIVEHVRQLEKDIEVRRTPALIIRFQEARNNLIEKYKDQQFIPEADAKKIITIAWLLTDPDAEKTNPGITKLEKWAWEPINDVTKMSRGYANFLWFYGGKAYGPWMNLVHIAWAKLGAEEQYKKPSCGSNRIFGETWTVAGIPIHFRNLLSKVKELKPWVSRISYLGLIMVILLVIAFSTRSFWLPLIGKLPSDSDELKESAVESKLPLSLKEIREDIDSRPLVQKEETAQRYVGISIEREPLRLFNIVEEDEAFLLMTVFPDQPDITFLTGWRISCRVKRSEYPELIGAKQGLTVYVSGIIQDAGTLYVHLSDVSLAFD